MQLEVAVYIMDSFELLESFLRMLVIISTFIPETFHNILLTRVHKPG